MCAERWGTCVHCDGTGWNYAQDDDCPFCNSGFSGDALEDPAYLKFHELDIAQGSTSSESGTLSHSGELRRQIPRLENDPIIRAVKAATEAYKNQLKIRRKDEI